jgi:hypothetical protein
MSANFLTRIARAAPLPLGSDYPALKAHVLERISDADRGEEPFFHLYIDKIFPDDFYAALHEIMRSKKTPEKMLERKQDNAAFVNRRYPLRDEFALPVRQFRAIYSDSEIKCALARKFYAHVTPQLVDGMEIHRKEFEFVFCEPNRFQNIHTDISPKYMSFVFYFPDGDVTPEAEEKNATVLYDRNMQPVYGARFRPNSVCVFVPHFYSYHGFSTTIERDVLVMFYINKAEMAAWNAGRVGRDGGPLFEWFLDNVESKLHRHPLFEYGNDPARISRERELCKVNAPQGRVMTD